MEEYWREEEEEKRFWLMLQNQIDPSSTSPENNHRHVATSPENYIHGNPLLGNRLYQNPRVLNQRTSSQNRNPIFQKYFCQNPTTENAYFQNPTTLEGLVYDDRPFLSGDYFGQYSTDMHEQGLVASLRRLNLSQTPPHHQSQFLAPPAALGNAGGEMPGNMYNNIPMMGAGSGFSPSTYDQNLLMVRNQQHNLQMMRIQSAVRGQMGDYSMSSHGATSLSNHYGLVPPNSSANSDQFRNYPYLRQGLRTAMNGSASSSSGISNEFNRHCHRQSPREAMSYDYPIRPSNSTAKDLGRSRFLQKKFEGKTEMDSLQKLMVEDAGQSKVKKIFEECDEEQITEILISLISDEQNLRRICTDNLGSRSMQKLLEYLKTPEQISLLLSALRNLTLPLTKCSTGQFLLTRCFTLFSGEDNKHILNEVVENCVEISTDKAGCCTMYRCVDYAVGEARERLVAEITAHAPYLSKHPYGNFVVQHILELRIPHVLADVVARLEGSFLTLGMDKFGSHVVEKCMRESGGEHSSRIIKDLISCPMLFLNFLQDKFGNYVAQSALAISKGATHQALVRLIEHHSKFLESHPCGKMVLARARGNKRR